MVMNFNDVAKTKIADIERPPLPPQGTYRWAITKVPASTTSPDNKWDYCDFALRAMEALDADMSDYKGEVNGITMQLRFIFDKNDEVKFGQTMFRLRNFLENHAKCADDKMSLAEALNASVNAQFLAPITWNPDKDDKTLFYANIGKTAPLD